MMEEHSKISNDIILNFALQKSDMQTGQSFKNNCLIYEYPALVEDVDVYFMECDMKGKPLDHNLIYGVIKAKKFIVGEVIINQPEYYTFQIRLKMLTNPKEIVDHLIKGFIDSFLFKLKEIIQLN